MLSDRKKSATGAESAPFNILCPCGCGRSLPAEYRPRFADNILGFYDRLLQQLGGDKSYEGVVDFLHEKASVN
ncbi:MAG: hypothetical protein V3V56_05730 [bacterium]